MAIDLTANLSHQVSVALPPSSNFGTLSRTKQEGEKSWCYSIIIYRCYSLLAMHLYIIMLQ